MIALNTGTGTGTTTISTGTSTGTGADTYTCIIDWGCTGNCRGCTMTCTVPMITYLPVTTYGNTEGSEPKQQEEIYIEPIDPELVKLRRKQIFQKRPYKTNLYIKPRLKRKSMVSISGWLTRSEYKKKKGHGIK